jgi:hypothetical protein
MENVRNLTEALAQVEELIWKMGGVFSPHMKIDQMPMWGDKKEISVKATMYFDLEKLSEYTAQLLRQE